MYVNVLTYFRCRTCLRVCARVHVRTYDVRTYAYMYFHSQPWELHALTYTHTMLLHIVLLLARRHCYSGVMSPHVRACAHTFYLSLRVLHVLGYPWELRGLTYAQTMLLHTVLLQHDAIVTRAWWHVRIKLLALQTDSSARGTHCTMCTPSYHSILDTANLIITYVIVIPFYVYTCLCLVQVACSLVRQSFNKRYVSISNVCVLFFLYRMFSVGLPFKAILMLQKVVWTHWCKHCPVQM